jgi:hypothetical protein
MLNSPQPALFVIVGTTPGGDFAVPAASARVVAQVVRHLTEYCPHTQTSWQVNPHAPPGPVAVFGGARSSIDARLRDQDAHVFLLAVGDPLPPVWIALCGHQVAGAEFDALDPGLGRPAQTATSAGPPPPRRSEARPVFGLWQGGEHLSPCGGRTAEFFSSVGDVGEKGRSRWVGLRLMRPWRWRQIAEELLATSAGMPGPQARLRTVARSPHGRHAGQRFR